MALTVATYTERHVPAVKDFNRRLRTAGVSDEHYFSETHVSQWLPARPGAPLRNDLFVVLEDDSVRGAYALKRQEFSFYGTKQSVDFIHHPVAEGISNKKYAQVGPHILMHTVRSNPLLFALGMSGYERPLPRMLQALKWENCSIPFYFRVNRPTRVLQNLQPMRHNSFRRIISDFSALTGLGWLGFKAVPNLRAFRTMHMKTEVTVVEEFQNWVDEIWERSCADYAMVGVRDARSVRALYPRSNRNFIRVKICAQGRPIGWAVVADIQRRAHPQYGDLRVGTILDGMGRPESAKSIVAAATRVLLARNVDLMISNQSHQSWQNALTHCGFFKGPSSFIFAASRQLSSLLKPFHESVSKGHINRGDGDSLLQYELPC